MNIGELKRNAKESLKGRWLDLVVPILITLVIINLIDFGISYLYSEMIGFTFYIKTIAQFINVLIFIWLFSGIVIHVTKMGNGLKVGVKEFLANLLSKEFLSIRLTQIKRLFIPTIIFFVGNFIFYICSAIIFAWLIMYLFSFGKVDVTSQYNIPLIVLSGLCVYIIGISMYVKVLLNDACVFYLNFNNPYKNTKELFLQSKDMIKGNKNNYIFLTLSFIGWIILSFIPMQVPNFIARITHYDFSIIPYAYYLCIAISIIALSFSLAYVLMTQYYFCNMLNSTKKEQENLTANI
jgi:uncharacterized membrane protein